MHRNCWASEIPLMLLSDVSVIDTMVVFKIDEFKILMQPRYNRGEQYVT